MADEIIDVTVFDDDSTPADESLVDVNGLLITHPEGGAIAGTGGYQPFLRQNNSDGSTQGFNTSDADTFKHETDEGLDMDKAWTTSLKVGDLPIVMIDGVAYYEIRLDLNEPNSGVDDGGASSILLELSEFQIYTSDRQATLADYTAGSGTVLGSDFDLVYDLDSGGVDRSLILTDGPSGSGRDDYIFYIPVSDVGTDPDLNFTLFAQFGPQPQEEATFEEFRIQNTAQLDGVKFNDLDSDGVRDAGEDGLEGFVMYIDANGNDLLDTGEVTAVSDADGNFSFHGLIAGTYVVREILSEDDISAAVKASPGYDAGDYLPPDGFWVLTTGVGGDHEFEIVKSGSDLGDATIEVGNHELNPSITIDKSAAGYGDCADTVGETITYTVLVTNDGDTVLSNVVLKDSFEGGGDVVIGSPTGDDGNGTLDPGETWTYTYTHEVNQDDIDGNGGGDGSIDNTATVTADSDQTDSTVTDNDDATVEVCQNPGIAIDKIAALDDDGDCVDEDGHIINYTYSGTNTGNVALDNVVVVDDKVTVVADDADNDGHNDGDTDDDGLLDV
ncbi:MAG TPA: SdrD B-like domain-containing protein, partial [Sphingomicrobium sp.]|nr:SdrD B-like domain-containing protein [Sphingomicrobium sp.]